MPKSSLQRSAPLLPAPDAAGPSAVDVEARERQLDLIFGALANRTRRTMLAQLALAPTPVKELAAAHPISLPAVSRHLSVLQEAGLLARERDGRVIRCALDPAPLQDAVDFIERYTHFWNDTLDALARYAEGVEDPARSAPPDDPKDSES